MEVIGWSEYASLLKPTLKIQASYASGLVRHLSTRARGTRPSTEWVALPSPPDSIWVRAARRAAYGDLADSRWMLHAERTWLFARALAEYDGQAVDNELLYVACLLHDVGLFREGRTRCFAIESAKVARSISAEQSQMDGAAEDVAEAIASHVSVIPGNVLGKYLREGSLLDINGMRTWDLDGAYVANAYAQYPRSGFSCDLRVRWRDECARFPYGRAAFARWPGGLTLSSYVTPLLD